MSIYHRFFRPDSERFLAEIDRKRVVAAIQHMEQRTSGEIRVYLESKCRFVNPIDRAAELFFGLKMNLTEDRNAVLVYVATKHHQYAIFADEGIYTRLGRDYWETEAAHMLKAFQHQDFANGIIDVIHHVGEALHQHFPYDRTGDKNELPDDIVFGR